MMAVASKGGAPIALVHYRVFRLIVTPSNSHNRGNIFRLIAIKKLKNHPKQLIRANISFKSDLTFCEIILEIRF